MQIAIAARRLSALLAVLALLAPAVLRADPQPASPPAAPPAGTKGVTVRVDLNTAGQAELETLPRIGPAMAQKILEYRKQVGTIKNVDELLNVKGIGEKVLEVLKPLVSVGTPPAASPKKP